MEVIDSSYPANFPAFSVSGAKPECWKVKETWKEAMAELSGTSRHPHLSQGLRRRRRDNAVKNNGFMGKKME